jgi:hypothetical protein
MAGFVPAIHVSAGLKQDVDARPKAGHDSNVIDPWLSGLEQIIV